VLSISGGKLPPLFSYAMTVHKSQRPNAERAAINLSLKGLILPSLTYVAVLCVRNPWWPLFETSFG
jgi:hypothetical protein